MSRNATVKSEYFGKFACPASFSIQVIFLLSNCIVFYDLLPLSSRLFWNFMIFNDLHPLSRVPWTRLSGVRVPFRPGKKEQKKENKKERKKAYVDDLAPLSTRTSIHAPCLSTLEYSKLHANQHSKNKNNGLLRNPCPPPRPGGSESTLARFNHAPLSRVLTLPNLRPSIVPYARSLPIWVPWPLILDPK